MPVRTFLKYSVKVNLHLSGQKIRASQNPYAIVPQNPHKKTLKSRKTNQGRIMG
jgi:hypothetical protein